MYKFIFVLIISLSLVSLPLEGKCSDETSIFTKGFNYCSKNSDVILQLTLLTAASIDFLGRLYPKTYPKITEGNYALMSFLGLISLNLAVQSLQKSIGDFTFSLSLYDLKTSVFASIKSFVEVSEISLMLAGCVVSGAFFTGNELLPKRIYSVTIPTSIASLIVSFALDIYNYFSNAEILSFLEGTNLSDQEIENLMILLTQHTNNPLFLPPNEDNFKAYSALIRSKIDPFTWDVLISQSRSIKKSELSAYNELFKIIIQNIHTQQSIVESNLGLKIFGSIGLLLSRAYPHSLVQASIGLSSSVLYSIKLLYGKIMQADQQESIQKITQEKEL